MTLDFLHDFKGKRMMIELAMQTYERNANIDVKIGSGTGLTLFTAQGNLIQ